MILYDIFYHDQSFDREITLPSKVRAKAFLAYAVCKNGENEVLYWSGKIWKTWRELTNDQRSNFANNFKHIFDI